MRYPQVLIYESDGQLAGQLRSQAEEQKWSLREPRSLEASLRLLRRGGPAVLVIKLGRDLVRELILLDRAHELYPDAGLVVVGDRDDPTVAALAWDLGAAFVLMPPSPRTLLPEIVRGLLTPSFEPPRSAVTTTAAGP